MSFVAAAIIAPQYIGASMAADATREGASIAGDASIRGQQLQLELFRQAQRTLQPFTNLGLGAGSTLAAQSVSPAERQRQFQTQRLQLESDVQRLSRPLGFNDVPQVMGKNGSERWAAAVQAANANREGELREAQSKLSLLDQQMQLDQTQAKERSAEGVQASPLYEFQRDLGERNIKRQLAATGRQDTGFGMETLSNFYRALGAEETDRQTGRLQFLTNIGANAAAGQATQAMNTGTTQATLTAQAGQLYGTGVANAGQITGAGVQGIGRNLTQVGMLALLAGNAGLFGGGGDPSALGGTASAPGTGSTVNVRPAFGGQPSLLTSTY